MALLGILGRKKEPKAPPPPPRTFNMNNIYDVIEYCILKDPENATQIITDFLQENPSQINQRYTKETMPERGADLWGCDGATPIMVLMRFNDADRSLHDFTEDGQKVSAPANIFQDELFDNLINLGADLNILDDTGRNAIFYVTDKNKNIGLKLLENGLEYNSFFDGEKKSIDEYYSPHVNYTIQEFESGKFVKHDDQTVALSHIFYVKPSNYCPNGDYHFSDIGRSTYITRKRLLFDFQQCAVHAQEGYDGTRGKTICSWRTKDIESFDTYLNQGLIQRAKAFMDSGAEIESQKQQTQRRTTGMALIK